VTQHRRRLTAAAAAVAATLALGAVLTGCTNDNPPGELPAVTITTSTTTTTTTATLDPTQKAIKNAKAAYRDYLAVTTRISKSGGKDGDALKALEGVATGDALASAQHFQRFLVDKGWTVEGDAPLAWIKVTKAAPKAVTLRSCEDASALQTTDRDGNHVSDTDPKKHVIRTATVKPIGDKWKIAATSAERVVSCSGN
jgi:hypothetical protein